MRAGSLASFDVDDMRVGRLCIRGGDDSRARHLAS